MDSADKTDKELAALLREAQSDPRTGPEVRIFTDKEEAHLNAMQFPHPRDSRSE